MNDPKEGGEMMGSSGSQTRAVGKWIIQCCGAPTCQFCGGETHYTDDCIEGYYVYPFCPYCGKPMDTEYKPVKNFWEWWEDNECETKEEK